MRHHLVVLHERYLDSLLASRKRIECRLSAVRRPPFEAVSSGDLLWFKLPSRAVHALAVVGRCLFCELKHGGDLGQLIRHYAGLICADRGFFEDAAHWARFATLIWIQTVVAIRPMPVYKSDKRAWVVLDQAPWPGMRIGLPQRRPSSLLKIAPLGPDLPPGGAVIKSATPRFPDRGDGVEKFR